MPIQQQHYQITGMKQDNLVGTGFSTKFAHEIKNMRLNTIGDYTTGVWTTERGTKKLEPLLYTSSIYIDREGNLPSNPITDYFPYIRESLDSPLVVDLSSLIVLGEAIINDQWVLFGKITPRTLTITADCILRLFYNDNKLRCEILYFGNLNFNVEHPIETLPYFENDNIQKIYFTDGFNQPRFINIVNVKSRFKNADATNFDIINSQFDFIREVQLREKVTITKLQSGAGLFPPCTVKYAITYYDKYGQETNIIYDSPLYYPTKGDRGCSPDELSGDSFKIKVYNFDTSFDYIRLYSIIRTSEDATPIVRIVADKSIKDSIGDDSFKPYIQFTDTNTTGEIVDPTILQYVGGKNITAKTLDQKTNTLFLGNICLRTKSASDVLHIWDNNEFNPSIVWENSTSFDDNDDNIWKKRLKFNIAGTYPYTNQLNPSDNYYTKNNNYSSHGIKHFKKGEFYRFGLQFQDKYGVWSEVVHTTNMDSINTEDLKILYNNLIKIATIDFPIPTIELSQSDSVTLYNNGYRKVRLVCAKKNNTNRTTLAQGVIDSTVWEQKTRGENGPYAMTSWFFRPKEAMYNNYWYDDNTIPSHSFTFGYGNYDCFCTRYTKEDDDHIDYTDYYTEIENIMGNLDGSKKLPLWHVDRELLTFHSPELEFDDTVKTLDNSNYKLRVVGYVPIEHISSSYYISTDFTPISGTQAFTSRYYEPFNTSLSPNLKTHGVNNTISYKRTDDDTTYWAFLYPFQNADMGIQAGYDYKIYGSLLTSNMPVFKNTTYYVSINGYNPKNLVLSDSINWKPFWKDDEINEINLDYFKIFEKGSSRYTQIPISKEVLYYDSDWTDHNNPGKVLPYLTYASTINMVAPTNKTGIYPMYQYADWYTKPVGLGYNTSTHGILVTNNFPSERDDQDQLWNCLEDRTIYSEYRPYLWLVNLEKESVINESYSDEIFTPCGPAITLQTNKSTEIYGLEGDHYFMRYDCLKTFPRNTQDRNQIVEILSFMVETRINLDGRYDTNRGMTDNTTVTGDNFNLINKSYTQDNDFFAYITLDKQSATLNQFSNQITYTSVKIPNEDVDAWTNITLAKVDDSDGTCGAINKIINVNDKLFLFQEHGIAKINYDEKTTLTTDTGVPIELNSSGKYTGLDYISREVGCQNKWSISSTKNGLLWVDDSRRELLAMDENMTSVTTLNGFDAFMIDNCNPNTSWKPNFTNNNFITHYDKLSKDLYFINNNTCLAWNEISKTFTSFYDYNNVGALATIDNHTLVYKFTNNNTFGIYALREEDKYSYFFNEYKPYWMTLVCDGSSNENNNFQLDKVFDTIEYRADIFNMDGDIQTPDTRSLTVANPIFDKKAAWNSYQVYKEFDINAERKFNTWRVQLPRATYTDNQGNLTTTRDRIRNPFCYIKLLNTNNVNDGSSNPRMILHDLAVSYSIK